MTLVPQNKVCRLCTSGLYISSPIALGYSEGFGRLIFVTGTLSPEMEKESVSKNQNGHCFPSKLQVEQYNLTSSAQQ